jgi:hypothetical protein
MAFQHNVQATLLPDRLVVGLDVDEELGPDDASPEMGGSASFMPII